MVRSRFTDSMLVHLIEVLCFERVLDFIHFALNAQGMYYYSVTQFGNPMALGKITW